MLACYLPYQPHKIYPATVDNLTAFRDVGKKQYELKDHLGNVRVLVTDRKQGYVVNASPQDLKAEITGINNYYPFGMLQPGRNYVGGNNYRFGFNGKEMDPEAINGGGPTYDYGFRIYHPGIARFLSIDPLFKNYS